MITKKDALSALNDLESMAGEEKAFITSPPINKGDVIRYINSLESRIEELEKYLEYCEKHVSKVYDSITYGQLTKMNTDSMYILDELDRNYQLREDPE